VKIKAATLDSTDIKKKPFSFTVTIKTGRLFRLQALNAAEKEEWVLALTGAIQKTKISTMSLLETLKEDGPIHCLYKLGSQIWCGANLTISVRNTKHPSYERVQKIQLQTFGAINEKESFISSIVSRGNYIYVSAGNTVF